ncbi:MAG: penicillin-binding protein [Patescibacteria group bacterium]
MILPLINMDAKDWLRLARTKMKRRRFIRGLSFKKRLVYYLPVLAFFSLVFMIVLGMVVFAVVAKDLPSPDGVVRREGFATQIYDRNGELIYDVFKEAKRSPVSLSQIPDPLKWATIAIEDKDFYSHPGFSARGMARAVFSIVFRGKLQGGSTLTQQLVKTVLLSPQRTISRKIKEFILAMQIEKKYSKDEILQMYLNEAPYGGTAFGVGAASEQYFGKPVSELNWVESVVLAGLPQRPSVYSPFRGDLWKDRAKLVIGRLLEDGYIDSTKKEELITGLETLEFGGDKDMLLAPHFVVYVRQLLAERYGEELVEQGGLKVTTSLDLSIQKSAEKAVAEELDKVEGLKISNGATVVLDPNTGEILAMIGSKDYFDDEIGGKFNVITQGVRQPGSAIKPLTYTAGFRKGYTASQLLMDTKTVFPVVSQKDYEPVNYDGEFRGPIQLRYALGNSINVPAVKMLAMVGLKPTLELAEAMGISTLAASKENLSRLGLSMTLGGGEVKPIELANAYCAFANGGVKKEPVAILKVEDVSGREIWKYKAVDGKQVLSPEEAFLTSDILADNNARSITFGQNSGLVIAGKKVAVKTGTTNDKRDNWAVGWTPNILVLSWVGNNDNSPMKEVASGVSGATPIRRRTMMAAIDKLGYQEFVVPKSIVTLEVDKISGFSAHDGFPSRTEYFIKGTEPTKPDPVHLKLKTCRQTGQLATPPQIASGDYDEKEFLAFHEDDPISTDGVNRWQEGITAWISEHNDDKYHPPGDYCQEGGLIEVGIDSPANHATVENNFPVKIKANGVKKIVEVIVYVDDQEKKVFTSKPYELDLSLDDGTYTIKVVARDTDGATGEREAEIGVNLPWDWQPSPTPSPTTAPTAIPTGITPSPTP